MRIKHLPPNVLKALGVTGKKQAAYLKKVKEYHCDRLSYHDACPRQCWRCYAHLAQLGQVTRERSGSDVGFWQRALQVFVAERLEAVHELDKETVRMVRGEDFATASLADAARAFLESIGL
jgi:hypothetical protein